MHQGRVSPIDFGNAVFGYYLWDAVFLLWMPLFGSGDFDSRCRAYIEGYRQVRPLPAGYQRVIQALFLVCGLVETYSALNYTYAAQIVPQIKIPRAVWVARRLEQGVGFLPE